MNFFKRYYDKVILLVLFLLCIGLMVYVESIHSETREVDTSKLNIKRPKAYDSDIEAEKQEALKNGKKLPDVLNFRNLWNEKLLVWKPVVGAEPVVPADDSEDAIALAKASGPSELVKAEKLAVCPYCTEQSGVQTLIPIKYFGKKCTRCGNELKAPTKEQLSGLLITANDSDGDGIPNDVETKYGLNPDDARDARYDSDGDGFSNAYEISKNTSPTNSAEHPPLWSRLILKQIGTVTLPIELKVVNTNNSADKSQWEIQYNLPRTNRRTKKVQTKSYFVTIGEEIQVDENDRRRYAIVDVQHLPTPASGDNKMAAKETVKNNAASESDDKSASSNVGKFIVKLREVVDQEQSAKAEIITMITGQPVKSADARPEFEDTGRPGSRSIIRRIGTEIVMTNLENGKRTASDVLNVARYRILEYKLKNAALGITEDSVVLAIVNPREKDASKWETVTIKVNDDEVMPQKMRVSKEVSVAEKSNEEE